MADEENKDQLSDEVDDQQVEDQIEQTDGDDQEPSFEEKLKEVVDVEVEDVGTLRKKLTVKIPHETVTEQLGDQYDELRSEAAVPGFRKGRAPRRLLEKRFGREVGEQLVQQLVSGGYMAASDKSELKILGDPRIWVKTDTGEELKDIQAALPELALPESEEDFVFSCEVEIQPDFELPKLESIPLEKPAISVTDDDVTQNIERMLQYRGTFEQVTDGAAEADNLIVADVKMSTGDTVLEEADAARVPVRAQVVAGVTLESLGDDLAGAKVGDVKTSSGTLPDDYPKEELRGKPVDFEFKVREIQRLVVPELDDDMVKAFGCESEADLREMIKGELEGQLGEQIRQAMIGQVYEYLLANTTMDLPEGLSQRQEARALTRRMLELYRQGVPPTEVEKQMDELKTTAKDAAANELKRFFIMEKLAEEFEVDVDETEINGMISAIAARQGRRFDRVRDELAKDNGIMDLYLQLRDEKIIQQLIDKAEVTEATPDVDEEKPAKKKATKKKADETDDSASEGDEKPKAKKKVAKKKAAKKKSDDEA